MNKKIMIPMVIILIGMVLIPAAYFLSNNIDPFFSSGGRYDDSALINMGNLYASESDNFGFREGYSTTADCPWGFIHNGMDYFLNNDSSVLAAAAGKMILFENRDWGAGTQNRYTCLIQIRFNRNIVLEYNFEMSTTDIADQVHQERLFNIGVGDWIAQGEEIAKFLNIDDGHIHFGIKVNGEWSDPTPYYSPAANASLINVMQTYNPTWEYLSYA